MPRSRKGIPRITGTVTPSLGSRVHFFMSISPREATKNAPPFSVERVRFMTAANVFFKTVLFKNAPLVAGRWKKKTPLQPFRFISLYLSIHLLFYSYRTNNTKFEQEQGKERKVSKVKDRDNVFAIISDFCFLDDEEEEEKE
ncbi:hypothetical protein CEXT_204121 [Caerostris extrusa]|uniref:Transmembrane protein n=1 Tax=Caerostris extrusa TaxID=172846 RepID=A0AAV4PNB8_CAEEX|nr:hypothetical protein CEXT_204121 [Caerostris extrusa]